MKEISHMIYVAKFKKYIIYFRKKTYKA